MKSIYDTICDAADSKGYLPDGAPLLLPDHTSLDRDLQENWVPGEFEAVVVRLPYRLKEMSFINYMIARTVCKCIKSPTPQNKKKMYAKLKKYAPVSIADPVLSYLAGMKVERARAVRLAKELITKSDNRSLVKFGIVLLGAYGKRDDCDMVCRVGVHEEFTFFAAKAIRSLDKTAGYQDKLRELAERTSGWGKIAAVLEFSDHALTEETEDWILKYGCKNTVGLPFLACECAIKGELGSYISEVAALSDERIADSVGADMTDGICDIIEGLLQGSAMKECDGVNEVPDVRKVAENLRNVYERGAFSGNTARIGNMIKRLCEYLDIK